MNKAHQLKILSTKLSLFSVPQFIFFSVSDWQTNKKNILIKINNFFAKEKYLAVRSSTDDEDKIKKSNAGKYLSLLNVKNNKQKLTKSIDKVIQSYKKNNRKLNIKKDLIIVQQMINDSTLSGVLFNFDPINNLPYYVINYDDISGKTDTVTSGNSSFSNRILFILKNHTDMLKSKRFRVLLQAVKELEKNISLKKIDIEFVLDKNLKPFLLQARSLQIPYKKNRIFDYELANKCSNEIKNKIQYNNRKYKLKSVYGHMPDWNPIELIGRNPKELSYSLYVNLITSYSWIKARQQMGYKKYFKNNNLMINFLGQPYIDVRKSFFSYLPNKLNNNLSKKVVKFWINKLIKNPSLHDKVEFDLAITCYFFNIEKSNIFNDIPLTSKEKKTYVAVLKNHFNDLVSISKTSNLIKNQNKIDLYVKNFEVIKLKQKKFSFPIIKETLLQARKLTTLFAAQARHAFISKTILNSLTDSQLITENKKENFLNEIKTIASEYLDDLNLLNKKKVTLKFIKSKYGHLRPGTYDIESKSYRNQKRDFFENTNKNQGRITFYQNNITKKDIEMINAIIKRESLKINNFNNLIKYLKLSIQQREYSKFIFTKYIEIIFNRIIILSKKIYLKKKLIPYLSINQFIQLENNYFNKNSLLINKKLVIEAEKNLTKYNILKHFKLPSIIYDTTAPYVIPYQINKPNFITNKIVQAPSIFLNDNINFNLKGKILIIEGADPGYDWIFSKGIKGLITKWGGANSHMAIRCNELGITAAIGCGEQIYESLKDANLIEINCKTLRVNIIK